MATILSIWV